MRRRLVFGLILLALGPSTPAWARSIQGVHLDEKIRVLDQSALLNGAGLLEATVLNLDIYVAGLYLRARQHTPAAILKCDALWVVRMTYLRDIGRETFQGGWRDALEGRPERGTPEIETLVRSLVAKLPDVEAGDRHVLGFDPHEGFWLTVNGKAVFRSKNRTFARLIIRGFVDPEHAPGGIAPWLLGRR